MSKYVLTTKDRKDYSLTLSDIQEAQLRQDIIHGRYIEAGGDLFLGTGCKLTKIKEDLSQLLLAAEIFTPRPEGKQYFWEELWTLNNQRNEEGKPWIFRSGIAWVKRQAGLTKVAEVVQYFDDHEGLVHNTPEPYIDHEAKKMVREYLQT